MCMLLKALESQLSEMNPYLTAFPFFILSSYTVLMKYLLHFMFSTCTYRMPGTAGLGNTVATSETDLASAPSFHSFSSDNNLAGPDSSGLNIESVVMSVADDGSRGASKNLSPRMQDALTFNSSSMDASMDSKNGEQTNVCKVNPVFL